MKTLGTAGRVIFALAFAGFGIIHLIMGAKFGGEVPEFFRFGSGAFWVYLTGVAYLLACISIIIEKQTALACTLLGIVLFIIALTVHLPGAIHATGQAQLQQLINLIKAAAIGGAAWYIAGTYAWKEPAPAEM